MQGQVHKCRVDSKANKLLLSLGVGVSMLGEGNGKSIV